MVCKSRVGSVWVPPSLQVYLHLDIMADLHFQLQQNSREYQDYLSSLNSWEQEMKKKEGKKNNPKINKLALPQVSSFLDM